MTDIAKCRGVRWTTPESKLWITCDRRYRCRHFSASDNPAGMHAYLQPPNLSQGECDKFMPDEDNHGS